MPELASIRTLDVIVLVTYFVGLLVAGLVLGRRRQRSTGDYFLGGRSMPAWAVAISTVATALSAATFVGGPSQSFRGDLTYLSANIGTILAAVIVAVFFIPAFYRANVMTVYELLGQRFGPPAKVAASIMFMVGRVFANGARIYIAARAVAFVLFQGAAAGPTDQTGALLLAIALMTIVGVFYTLAGGIASIIYTDAIQTLVFVAAGIGAVIVLISLYPGSAADLWGDLASARTASGTPKLALVTVSTNPSATYTLWTAIVGFTLLNIAAYGTDHDLVQRLLTCKSAARGSWSVIAANLAGLPIVVMFLVIGLLLFACYNHPGLDPGYPVGDPRDIFLTFIRHEVPVGLAGLMIAGLFAIGVGSLNSALNAMASTLVGDIYRPVNPRRSERHYVVVGRLAVVGWGIVLAGFAALCIRWEHASARAHGTTLLDFALSVMLYAYAGLLAVFVAALFTRQGDSRSIIAGLVVGFGAVAYMEFTGVPLAYPWRLPISAALAFSVVCLGRPSRPALR